MQACMILDTSGVKSEKMDEADAADSKKANKKAAGRIHRGLFLAIKATAIPVQP